MWVSNSNFYFPSRQISDKLYFRSFLFDFFVFGPVLVKNRLAPGRMGQTDAMHLFAFSASLYFQASGPLTFYLGKVELQVFSLQPMILLKALMTSPHFAGIYWTAPQASQSVLLKPRSAKEKFIARQGLVTTENSTSVWDLGPIRDLVP